MTIARTSEARNEWAKFRWEFMRRDPSYIEDYRGFKTLEGENDDIDSVITAHKRLCNEYGISFPLLLDPGLTYKELQAQIGDSPWIAADDFCSLLVIDPWLKELEYEEPVPHDTPRNWPNVPGFDGIIEIEADGISLKLREAQTQYLVFVINLERLNSVDQLKKALLAHIDSVVKAYRTLVEDDHQTQKMVDYGIILLAGDLKSMGLKNEEISRRLYPRDYNPENEKANPESAIKKVSLSLKRYRDLTHGGWKNITFP